MDNVEIRVHPSAATIMCVYPETVEEIEVYVRNGIRFEDALESLSVAASHEFAERGIPEAAVDIYMRVIRMAFSIIEKRRGTPNEI